MIRPRPKQYFFAGGGTGGHIYPALAVAQHLQAADPEAIITFFCSQRPIDSQILDKSGFRYVVLPGKAFNARPDKFVKFAIAMWQGNKRARLHMIKTGSGGRRRNAVMIGTGGYVSVGPAFAANKLNIPVALINVDSIPGKANNLISGIAKEIFVQFEHTAKHFSASKAKISTYGCPLRMDFNKASRQHAIEDLGLDANKKTLLITGASSGSVNINTAIARILEKLSSFADSWQIVHLVGSRANLRKQESICGPCRIKYELIDYYDQMANLYAVADLVVGRAGAVSVAEYAIAGLAAICVPYPYHKDKHQSLNAKELMDAGAAVVAEDAAEDIDKTAENIYHRLEKLMKDDLLRTEMSKAAKGVAKTGAAEKIAGAIAELANKEY